MSDNTKSQHMSDMILAQMEDSPQQSRSRDRIRRALDAAAQLLHADGLELFSIPEVAKVSEVPRAAIYRYFPDGNALLAVMAAASMDRLGVRVRETLKPPGPSPERLFEGVIAEAVGFFNADPVASILLFNGPFGVAARKANHRKSRLLVEVLVAHLPAGTPTETVALTIEVIFACLRYGYFRDGTVSPAIAAEALRAATAFLGPGGKG